MARGVAQSGSASALGAEGRWFESGRPDHRPLERILTAHGRAHLPTRHPEIGAIKDVASAAALCSQALGVLVWLAAALGRGFP